MPEERDTVAHRASRSTGSAAERCRAPGCSQLTQRASRTGLSKTHCKAHVEFHRRHGSFWHRSFPALDLEPYRKAAERWLSDHQQDRTVSQVSAALESLLITSGEPESAYDLRHLPPKEKARVALARLHKAGIQGSRLIELTLAVSARIDHRGPHGDHEFLIVQIAKAAHRLASGTHRTRSGQSRIPSKYPHSAGRVLRILGHQIWDVAAIVADHAAIQEIITMAEPEVNERLQAEAEHEEKLEAFTQEIKRVRGMNIGPEMFAKYERQLRRQYGIKD